MPPPPMQNASHGANGKGKDWLIINYFGIIKVFIGFLAKKTTTNKQKRILVGKMILSQPTHDNNY